MEPKIEQIFQVTPAIYELGYRAWAYWALEVNAVGQSRSTANRKARKLAIDIDWMIHHFGKEF
jgi:hypothetical protein